MELMLARRESTRALQCTAASGQHNEYNTSHYRKAAPVAGWGPGKAAANGGRACPTIATRLPLHVRLAFLFPFFSFLRATRIPAEALRAAPWRRETGAAAAPKWPPPARSFTAAREPQWRLAAVWPQRARARHVT